MKNRVEWNRETAFITGASSGLGQALAIEMSKKGTSLLLLGRNESNLRQVKQTCERNGTDALYFQCDLSVSKEIEDICRQVLVEHRKTPTLLFNCAGYNPPGFVMEMPASAIEKNFRVNTLAPVQLIQYLIPGMLKKGTGYIVNVFSASMYHSFPGMATYCSTKMALAAFHESLKAELHGTSIKTLYVNPGAFYSNYFENLKPEGALKNFSFASKNYSNQKNPISVAKVILKAIEEGKEKINLSSWKDKVGHHLNYWFPEFIDKMMINSNKNLLDQRTSFFQKYGTKR